MKKYFVAREGIQKGPWSLDEIKQNIYNKILSWSDHIYDDKANEWLFLFEFPQLTDDFNNSFKTPIKKDKHLAAHFDFYRDRVWYILKQNENYGPFTSAEMIQMLQSKTLFEYDFVWRQDQSHWKRLSEIADFRPENIKKIFEVASGQPVDPEKTFYRRRFPRAEYKCELLIHNKKKVFTAQSIQIGEGGASFQVDGVDFDLDSQIYLHFKPGRDVPAFNASCKVVSKNGSTYGVSFINVSSMVKEYIDKLTSKKAA